MERVDPDLLARLLELRSRAYAPYSKHPVAAVIETTSGRHFGGCNVEVAHYKSVCAEASAISAMIAAGERGISQVYLLGPAGRPCPPCGDCRQRLREFGGPQARVLLIDEDGRIDKVHAIEALLPKAFGPAGLGD